MCLFLLVRGSGAPGAGGDPRAGAGRQSGSEASVSARRVAAAFDFVAVEEIADDALVQLEVAA